MPQSLTELVEEIKRDPEQGARRLLLAFSARLKAAALGICHDETAADDLVLRTVDQAVRKIDTCREPEALYEWMYSILLNFYKKSIRSQAAKNTVFVDEVPEQADETAVDRMVACMDAEVLRKAVNALPKEMRETIVMHYFLDIPVKRMAQILMLPEGTVKSRLHYARLYLGGVLESRVGKTAFALLAAVLLCAGALWLGLRGIPGDIQTASHDWLTEELVPVCKGQRLGRVGTVSVEILVNDAGCVERRTCELKVENDGAVLFAPCQVVAKGCSYVMDFELLQIEDDIFGRVTGVQCVREEQVEVVRVVAQDPAADEIAVGAVHMTFLKDVPAELLEAQFAWNGGGE